MSGVPTQVAHPWRSVLRTFVVAAVGLAAGWIFRTLGIDLTDLAPAIVDSLTGIVWGLVTALAQRALSHPAVESFLAGHKVTSVLATGVHTEPKPRVVEELHPDSLF